MMPNLLYPYLVGLVATVVVPLLALLAFAGAFVRAMDFERRQARLPLATRYEDLSMRVDDLQKNRDDLAQELADAHRTIDDADRERSWLEEHREEIMRMREELKDLVRVNQDYEQAQEKLADANQKLDRAAQEMKLAEFETKKLQDEADRLKGEIDSLTNQRDVADKELANLREKRERGENELREARKEHNALEERAAKLKSEELGLRSDIERLQKQRDELKHESQAWSKSLQAAQSKVASTEAELAGLEGRVKQSAEHLSDVLKRLDAAAPLQADSSEALKELWSPVIDGAEFEAPKGGGESEAEHLEAVESYLRGHELVFARRTVRAFHTALKTARDTPLLVLAGISGTGKSLLPRRYAEAMGIHFLAAPVQPRWDGPQDLVGFYNYLENRYKATEFIRSLVQFDEHCADWAPEDYQAWLDDRLLIVLLDEMNLARVEYYFSEFLSRLETRRDTDPKSEADRAKASLSLDVGNIRVGAGGQNGRSVAPRVFVDTNVMFVGTMNEDESTMSLSDKVLDRAAMMRFGKPETFGSNLSGGTKDRAEHFLPRAVWSEWIEKGEARDDPEIASKLIGGLNDALSHVGKPFGWRTRDAILSYVKQYPDQSAEGHRYALADQIEQRIMPKLRGVDVNEDSASRAIEDVLRIAEEELKDMALSAAIESARSTQSGHLFQWTGVVRAGEG
jgi:uncharacterized coiled-coil DUF342 family protein